MSFKSYRAEPLDDDCLALDQPRPLVFSGPHGLIARHIHAHRQTLPRTWNLCPGGIHSLAMPDLLVRDRIIIFEEMTEDAFECQWLQQIQGTSNATTEMMFTFSPLKVLGRDHGRLIVQELKPRRTYAEDLCLDGGLLNLQGPWRWRKPHLALGGVVLGPHQTASKPLIAVP